MLLPSHEGLFSMMLVDKKFWNFGSYESTSVWHFPVDGHEEPSFVVILICERITPNIFMLLLFA
jgi:hypothetical protein